MLNKTPENTDNTSKPQPKNGIPYKNIVLEFPADFALKSITFKNFTNGQITLEILGSTFRQWFILQKLFHSLNHCKFNLPQGIGFSFDFTGREYFKVASLFKEIFTNLKCFKIADGYDHIHSVHKHFAKFLEEYYEDFSRNFPGDKSRTEIRKFEYTLRPQWLYKRAEFLPPRGDSDISHIIFTSTIWDTHIVILEIETRTYLQFPFLLEQLAAIQWTDRFYNVLEGNIQFHFNRSIHPVNNISTVFKKIFTVLKSFNIPDDVCNKFDQALCEYLNSVPVQEFVEHTIEEDSSARSKYLQPLSNAEVTHVATVLGDTKTLVDYLRKGYSPNNVYDSKTLVEHTLYGAIHESTFDETLKILSLLLEYKANVNKSQGHFSPLEFIVRLFQHSRFFLFYNYTEIIRLLMSAKDAFPHIRVHPKSIESIITDRHMAKMVAKWNNDLVTRKATTISRSIYRIASSLNAGGRQIQFETFDGNSFTVEERRSAIYQRMLTAAEEERIFKIFDGWYEWPRDKDEMWRRNYFKKTTLYPSKGELYIDLIKDKNGQIMAFTVSEILEKKIDGKTTFVYYVRMAMALGAVSKYPKLMSYLFYRGFALKMQRPDVAVDTIFEAASHFSYLLIRGLYANPKFAILEKVIAAHKDNLYAENILFKKNGIYCIKDELADIPLRKVHALEQTEIKETSSRSHPGFFRSNSIELPQGITARFYHLLLKYIGSGYIPVIAFEITPENFIAMKKLIDPYVDFEKIIKSATDDASMPLCKY